MTNIQKPDEINADLEQNFGTDLNDFIQTEGGEVVAPKTLREFENIRITIEKNIPVNEPFIRMGGKGIASKNNITGISAAVKQGKTAFVSAILAGAISRLGKYEGFCDLQIETNDEGKAVVDIDTEQAEDDQQHKVKTILARNGYMATPENYLSYNFRQLPRKQYKDYLNQICEAANKKFNGIHLISIDGAADFCESVNDDREAAELVEYFTHLAIKFNCPVLLVIHLNPGSDKERGHLGSEIQRKCYGLITISKKDDISTATVKVGRKAGTSDTPAINFRYDPEKGYHTECDAPVDGSFKAGLAKTRQKEETAKAILKGQTQMRYNGLKKAIMKETGSSEGTAKNWIKDLEALDIITKLENGSYILSK
ncbi:MAG: AAA family ATPase [Chitinophagaceae bacterium]|nr:AAA family ATPase [Chitinophagaceae bacterium]